MAHSVGTARPWSAGRHLVPGLLLAGGLLLPGRVRADAVDQLVRILQHATHYKQRATAAIGLARRRDPRAIPVLIDALDDPHPTVQAVSAGALGKLRDARARGPLEALIARSKDRFVRSQARQALAQLPQPLPQHVPRAPAAPAGRQMRVAGTLGTLDQYQIQEGIAQHLPQANDCFAQAFESAPFLGGKIRLRFRITERGTVSWVRIEHSDLGSLQSERCILGAMKSAAFEPPEGGEAEFTIPLTFGGGDPVVLLGHRSAVADRLRRQCHGLARGLSPPAGLVVTIYLDTNGRVLSAGLSAEGELPPTFAERFIANLKRIKLGRTGTQSNAKLIYRFSCPG